MGHEVSKQAADRLRGIGAHAPFESAIENVPFDMLGERVERVPYTIWQLVEHLRLAQRDILEYAKDPSHESPAWPEGYWPEEPAPPSEDAYRKSVNKFLKDQEELIALLSDDPARMIEGTEHSILREVLIAASHLSYHTGQIVLLRRLLGCWDQRPST